MGNVYIHVLHLLLSFEMDCLNMALEILQISGKNVSNVNFIMKLNLKKFQLKF